MDCDVSLNEPLPILNAHGLPATFFLVSKSYSISPKMDDDRIGRHRDVGRLDAVTFEEGARLASLVGNLNEGNPICRNQHEHNGYRVYL